MPCISAPILFIASNSYAKPRPLFVSAPLMFWKPTRNFPSPSALGRNGSPTTSIFGMGGASRCSSTRSCWPPLCPRCALFLLFGVCVPPLRGSSSFSATPGLVASLYASTLSPIFYNPISPLLRFFSVFPLSTLLFVIYFSFSLYCS